MADLGREPVDGRDGDMVLARVRAAAGAHAGVLTIPDHGSQPGSGHPDARAPAAGRHAGLPGGVLSDVHRWPERPDDERLSRPASWPGSRNLVLLPGQRWRANAKHGRRELRDGAGGPGEVPLLELR